MTNVVKDMLKAGKTVFGTMGQLGDPVALLAEVGFDYIIFDTQHSPLDAMELQPIIAAMKGKPAIPLVRVAENDRALICKVLDIGAYGVIIPMIETKKQAMEAVNSIKYPPEGLRSSAPSPMPFWGYPTWNNNFGQYISTFNKDVMILPQIETEKAVDNIDEILSVPGVDVAMLGPRDLSISMGMPEDYMNPKYQAILDKIQKGAKKAGVAAGSFFIPGDTDVNKFNARGFRLITLPWRPMVAPAIKNAIDAYRK